VGIHKEVACRYGSIRPDKTGLELCRLVGTNPFRVVVSIREQWQCRLAVVPDCMAQAEVLPSSDNA
jgi:hypothetical protein